LDRCSGYASCSLRLLISSDAVEVGLQRVEDAPGQHIAGEPDHALRQMEAIAYLFQIMQSQRPASASRALKSPTCRMIAGDHPACTQGIDFPSGPVQTRPEFARG
jgi:hypothetical protein